MTRPLSAWIAVPWPVQVFAVDDCSIQLTWAASPAEGLRIEVGGTVVRPDPSPPAELVLDPGGVRASIEAPDGPGLLGRWGRGYLSGRRVLDPGWPAGPGGAVVDGLAPGTTYDIVASATGVPAFLAGRVRTLTPPAGRLLYKFATVSDVHIGEKVFGVLYRIHDAEERPPWACENGRAGALKGDVTGDLTGPRVGEYTAVHARPDGAPLSGPYPVRALRGAIDEAAAWGAELLVVKGDLTNTTSPAEVRDVGRILAESPIPVHTILGNHDNNFGVDVRGLLERQGVVVSWQPRAVDVPGLRLVLMSTASGNPRLHRGELSPEMISKIAALVAGSPGAAWVALHHPYEKHRVRTVYPPGLPFDQGRELLDALVAARRDTFVTFGHRHRNRRYDYGPLVVTEVGSTKDYPGVWAGYKVYEGGLVQVVRRTLRPDVISWTEATRRAVNGQWRRWSPGRLGARCLTVDWKWVTAHPAE